MSDPDSDPLCKAIWGLDRERLGPLLAERFPSLALMPDLNAVDFDAFSRVARIEVAAVRTVVVPFSAIREGLGGDVSMEELVAAQPGWYAHSIRRAFEDSLRGSIEMLWLEYYCGAYWAADRPKAASKRAASLDADIASHLRAAARLLRQRGDGDDDFANVLERFAAKDLTPAKKGRPRGVADAAFRRFLTRVFRLVEKDFGGRLTFYRQEGAGSLVEFVELLRPLMPPEFLPDWKHPPSYLETLGTKVRAEKDGFSEAPQA